MRRAWLFPAALALLSTACMVGPRYQRPAAPVPQDYKEQPPANFREAQGWRQAQPNDGQLKGKWWEIYNDPILNALEERVSINNQNVLLAEAQYREARDAVRIARSALYPTVTTGPSITESRPAVVTTSASTTTSALRTTDIFPAGVSYNVDLWGSIRHNVALAAYDAQASAATLENIRLLYQTDVALDYFQLHGLDGDIALLTRTVASYQDYLTLTRNRFAGGVASDLDVAQAESQLYSAQTTLTDFGVARAQFEHAIAVLTGQTPENLTLGPLILTTPPPPIPIELPSMLLERRPDIAAQERFMAAANEQVGIATAAFYPALNLAATAGFQNTRFTTWIGWPSRFFSIGPALAQTIYDGGRRRAQLAQTRATFDATVAAYRQTVLTAFQQVDDQLSTLRILSDEFVTVNDSARAAERALNLSTLQYKAGTTSYLTVITAQATALAAERTEIDLLTRRLTASVNLIQALGGGWDATQLPSPKDVQAGTK
jgi:NodT family efflux transporter outer membrane factor (OMF) lipoprotein